MARDFVPTAEQVVDDLLDADPELAHWAGDHRADGRLPDHSASAVRTEVARLREAGDVLSEVDPDGLEPEDRVDLQLLTSAVDARLFALTEVREHEWNPLVHNPGFLLHGLLTRETAPAAERLEHLVSRLEQLPDALATADALLTDCPTVHVETALGQVDGTAALVDGEVARLAAEVAGGGAVPPRVRAAQDGALAALDRHRARLRGMHERPGRDPRLGRPLWEAKLWHTLDSELTAAALLERAEANLAVVSERIAETAREVSADGGRAAGAAGAAGRAAGPDDVAVRAALDRIAADHPDDATIVARAAEALATVSAAVREHDLVTGVDDPLEILEMPEFARGVAVAYCDAPGPLETASVPTFYAIAPTPRDWPAERVASFYREYNDAMVVNLTVHEAVPGHYLQLAHARRFRGSTRVRALCTSGSFVEGWAVHTEEVMADRGVGGPAVRLQQLKMQLRTTINAILDQLVHCEGLSEADGMALMRERGFQEEGEAAGKWRRALLTSTQLSTYFVGWTEVAAIARARPAGTGVRAWHDAMLAHGSPSPRHLAALLGV